ncbi:hypothetical protein [Undibacterium flavidum]|uniref:Lipocalin-like protein n=1 Tax=Undibacterium flavidum TaxID=2762297 RepID=A0ABR6YGC1_9BURK|nr:hypothetical protein [Undibacterium flavidum]MBC3875619.1 hypothetical protein [Undibacterium flavidum]
MPILKTPYKIIASLLLLNGVSFLDIAHAQSDTNANTSTNTNTPLLGLWNFQTVIGTENEKDVMGYGVMKIAPKNKAAPQQLTANIVWLDDKGIGRSTREMQGELKNAQAVFTHSTIRTHTTGKGKAVDTEVKVIWTLNAETNTLIGTRQVRRADGGTDDDDTTKPVNGTRSAATSLPAVIPVVAPQERGPSTAEERARAVKIAVDAEKNLQSVFEQNNVWLDQWIADIPDLTFNTGAVANWLKTAAPTELRAQLYFQFCASAIAFQINNPTLAEKQTAYDLAGLEGALRAYEKVLGVNPTLRSAKLTKAITARDKGELPAFIQTLSGRDQ